ncbi:phage tail protein [Pseudomonas monsensis]|uniref:phage tail protein n=1 Tax=Pseudomonas monsensis TaxID=2745509 RepID=UPI002AB89A39|nr:phage tail protein [Pseudomonas monsensis]MDZ3825613.1 phage tail protein [Pseudomonas monsensis]
MIDANSHFFAILTNVGMAKQANADALGIPWLLTQMGVGDANPGGLADPPNPIPSAGQSKLLNEWRRKPLNQLKIDPVNPAVIIAEQIIPADEGGKWIREIGLYDADGDLVAVANCAPSFKPLLSQGSGRTQIVRMNFIVTSTGNIQLKIDPAIVLASRAYVDAAILEVLPKNKTPGEYTRVKVNDRGVVVSGDNPETLAGMGIKDSYTKPEVDAIIAQASALPVGATVAFPLDKVAPGFLELDGSVKSIAVYPDLAAFLGVAFNRGDEGAGNFRLPESRGEFLRGWDHGRGVDAGRAVGSWQKGTLTTFDDPSTGASVDSIRMSSIAGGADTISNPGDYPSVGMTFISAGTNAANFLASGGVTRPRNLAVMWCIKAWNAPINQGNIDVAALAAQVEQLAVNGPPVGSMRDAFMNVTAASATATFSAFEVVVGEPSGKTYRLRNFSQTLNLAAAVKGLGAMDAGAAPVGGIVAIYALYNPATKQHGATVVNVTGAIAPNLCAGVLPAGYSASALVSVWATNAAGLFRTGSQEHRSVTTQVNVLSGTSITSLVPLAMPGVPLNAKRVIGQAGVNSAASGAIGIGLASDANSLGFQFISSSSSNSCSGNFNLLVPVPGVIYYQTQSNAGTTTFGLSVTQYEF